MADHSTGRARGNGQRSSAADSSECVIPRASHLDVAGGDARALVVAGGVSGELEDLGGEVLLQTGTDRGTAAEREPEGEQRDGGQGQRGSAVTDAAARLMRAKARQCNGSATAVIVDCCECD